MVLHYNYNQVIRPRGDLMMERVKHFEMQDVFFGTDKEFCKRWGVDPLDLEEAKQKRYRKNDQERDILWQYVNSPN